MSDPEINVEFRIISTSISADEITKAIQINPTDVWHIGDSIQNTKLKYKHNGWCLSNVEAGTSNDLVEQIQYLLKILLPRSDLISEICKDNNLSNEMSCAVYIKDETPCINLDPEIINDLAKLGSSLDIDVILIE